MLLQPLKLKAILQPNENFHYKLFSKDLFTNYETIMFNSDLSRDKASKVPPCGTLNPLSPPAQKCLQQCIGDQQFFTPDSGVLSLDLTLYIRGKKTVILPTNSDHILMEDLKWEYKH